MYRVVIWRGELARVNTIPHLILKEPARRERLESEFRGRVSSFVEELREDH